MNYGLFGKPLGAEPEPVVYGFGKPFGYAKPFGVGKPLGKAGPYGTRVMPQPFGYSKVSKTPYGVSYSTVNRMPV